MGGGSQSSQDTSSQSVQQIPQWMNTAGQQNYAYAQDVANRPLQQYQGQMVADTAPQTQQFWNLAAQSPSVGQSQYAGASKGFNGALGGDPGTIAGTNLAPYMNPYTKNVIDATLPIMQQQNALSQDQQANAASAAGAFGGSRQGVQQGVAQAQGAQNIGQMLAQLNSANFTQAQGAAQQDVANRQGKINSDILASQGLGNLGTSMNQSNTASAGLLASAGASQSMQAQNQINSQMAKFNQANNYPNQQLGILLSALGMTPHDTATAGDSTTTTTTPTDWGSILTGGLGAASDIFKMSDKRAKKNITSLGNDPITGVPIKSFNYKGEAPGAPKVVGPMAQDIERRNPGSTVSMGGIRAVPRGVLAAATPSVAGAPTFSANTPGLAAYMPGSKAKSGALSNPRAGARAGGLANTRRKVMGALSA